MDTVIEEMVSVMIPTELKERLDFHVAVKRRNARRDTPSAPKVTLKSTIVEAFSEYLEKHKEEI